MRHYPFAILLFTGVLLSIGAGSTQMIGTPSVERVAKWMTYGVIANRVHNELYENGHNYPYMDTPYTESSNTSKLALGRDRCVIEQRVYALTNRTIFQYVNLCDDSVLAEIQQP